MQGCTSMFRLLHPCFFRAFGWSVDGAAQKIYNSRDLTSMPHPGLGDWSSRGETCFCPYGALVERADRDRRVDRVAPNESSVAHLRPELWPETCFWPDVHPKRQGRIHGFCGASDDHPCMHYRPTLKSFLFQGLEFVFNN